MHIQIVSFSDFITVVKNIQPDNSNDVAVKP